MPLEGLVSRVNFTSGTECHILLPLLQGVRGRSSGGNWPERRHDQLRVPQIAGQVPDAQQVDLQLVVLEMARPLLHEVDDEAVRRQNLRQRDAGDVPHVRERRADQDPRPLRPRRVHAARPRADEVRPLVPVQGVPARAVRKVEVQFAVLIAVLVSCQPGYVLVHVHRRDPDLRRPPMAPPRAQVAEVELDGGQSLAVVPNLHGNDDAVHEEDVGASGARGPVLEALAAHVDAVDQVAAARGIVDGHTTHLQNVDMAIDGLHVVRGVRYRTFVPWEALAGELVAAATAPRRALQRQHVAGPEPLGQPGRRRRVDRPGVRRCQHRGRVRGVGQDVGRVGRDEAGAAEDEACGLADEPVLRELDHGRVEDHGVPPALPLVDADAPEDLRGQRLLAVGRDVEVRVHCVGHHLERDLLRRAELHECVAPVAHGQDPVLVDAALEAQQVLVPVPRVVGFLGVHVARQAAAGHLHENAHAAPREAVEQVAAVDAHDEPRGPLRGLPRLGLVALQLLELAELHDHGAPVSARVRPEASRHVVGNSLVRRIDGPPVAMHPILRSRVDVGHRGLAQQLPGVLEPLAPGLGVEHPDRRGPVHAASLHHDGAGETHVVRPLRHDLRHVRALPDRDLDLRAADPVVLQHQAVKGDSAVVNDHVVPISHLRHALLDGRRHVAHRADRLRLRHGFLVHTLQRLPQLLLQGPVVPQHVHVRVPSKNVDLQPDDADRVIHGVQQGVEVHRLIPPFELLVNAVQVLAPNADLVAFEVPGDDDQQEAHESGRALDQLPGLDGVASEVPVARGLVPGAPMPGHFHGLLRQLQLGQIASVDGGGRVPLGRLVQVYLHGHLAFRVVPQDHAQRFDVHLPQPLLHALPPVLGDGPQGRRAQGRVGQLPDDVQLGPR
mmetsp:Transcript_3815/g.11438  ORF Transcript_3815/g.11438 Transcript_3815/m.11438 type:complete len:894 (-) Transcript_3815:521-3202(-)